MDKIKNRFAVISLNSNYQHEGVSGRPLFFYEGTTLDDYVTRHEYMERIGRSDDKMHSLDRRLSKVEELSDKLSDMAVTMQGMLVTLQTMQKEQAEQGERLRKIEEEPADKWNKVVSTVITVLVTAALTWLISKGGI